MPTPPSMAVSELDLKRLARASPDAEVHVYHALAGGIATHVEHEAAKAGAAGRVAILVRVGLESAWDLEIRSASAAAPYCPNLRPALDHDLPRDPARLSELAGAVHAAPLTRSPAFSWQATQALFDLVRDSGIPTQVTLHDYAAFCHRNNLVQPIRPLLRPRAGRRLSRLHRLRIAPIPRLVDPEGAPRDLREGAGRRGARHRALPGHQDALRAPRA